ncbi:MAG: hypothetical protein Q4E44_01970 [bacterium]|nr:hypothetical protein [bacterium]
MKKIELKYDAREIILVYGMPGIVICMVSLLAAVKVGNDFPDSSLAEIITFMASNLLLWLVYWTVFQSLPQEVMTTIRKERTQQHPTLHLIEEHEDAETTTLKQGTATEAYALNEAIEEQAVIVTASQTQAQPQEPSTDIIQDIYNRRRIEFAQSQSDQRAAMLDSIDAYIIDVMSPFAEMETIAVIQGEIRQWADDHSYTPSKVSVSNQLTTLDVRHFIWNIAARLRMNDNRYTSEVQGEFIKRMFPDICKDAEAYYLSKNLTASPQEGFIKIDRPTKDDFRFHLHDCE